MSTWITAATPRRRTPPAAAARGHRCSRCRRTAGQIARGTRHVQAALTAAAGDLETTWLVPCEGGFINTRFCDSCAPTGQIWSADCAAGCGAGPIVLLAADTLPGMPTDPRTREYAIQHLRREGWQADPDGSLTCPRCTAEGPVNT